MSNTNGSTAGHNTNGSTVTTSIETVTPAKASLWLGNMTKQRPLKTKHVDKLARDMMMGRWQLSGEPLIFSSTGQLLNGQHRLNAIIQSGKSVAFVVVRGVAPDAVTTMDTGIARGYADVLAMRGSFTTYRYAIAAAARLWFLYEHGLVQAAPAISHSELDQTIQAHPSLVTSAQKITSLSVVVKKFTPSVSTFVHAWCSEFSSPELADSFYELLNTGSGLAEGNPIYALRRRVIDNDARPLQTEMLALHIKTWNAWTTGATAKRVHWRAASSSKRQQEAFPEFVVPPTLVASTFASV